MLRDRARADRVHLAEQFVSIIRLETQTSLFYFSGCNHETSLHDHGPGERPPELEGSKGPAGHHPAARHHLPRHHRGALGPGDDGRIHLPAHPRVSTLHPGTHSLTDHTPRLVFEFRETEEPALLYFGKAIRLLRTWTNWGYREIALIS